MSTNRDMINDFDIVRPQILLDKGLPLPFLSGRYVVDEGWVGVITEGGAYRETLGAGTHFLNKYHMFRDVKAASVNMRLNHLTVATQREFTISQPVPVEINLDLSVEYQVKDPRRVAIEITSPLTSLYDRVIQAVRGAVVTATVDEIRTKGEGIATTTLQRLQGMQLPRVIGIEVFNVLVSSIKATDTGSDMLAGQTAQEYTTFRNWQLDNAILSQTKITPEWLMVNRPELYAQIMAGNQVVIKELIDKGLLDPAGFLNQAAGTQTYDPSRLLGAMGGWGGGMPGFGGIPGQGAPGGSGMPPGMGQAQLPGQAGAGQEGSTGGDIHSRIRDEVSMLEKSLPGGQVEVKPGTDERNIPDGSYDLRIAFPSPSGRQVTLYVSCPVGYPRTPPLIDVTVNDQDVNFTSAILRRWNANYLVEIAREVKQYYG